MKQFLKKHLITIILLLILFAGISLVLYPTISDYWNSFHQSRAIDTYVETVENMDKKEQEQILAAAHQYNEKISKNGIHWVLSEAEAKVYYSLLNISGTGIMGYITIPAINIKLPIYHGTDEDVFQVAVGHLEGSSLPIGGESTHSVLSGHRGLPSAKLFTDLDQLQEGDIFTITVLNEVLTYQVDQIRIVEPHELKELGITKGKDYVTLVTCTPYGVNTHRLLVRGTRIETTAETLVTEDAKQMSRTYVAFVITGLLLVFVIAAFLVCDIFKRRQLSAKRKLLEKEKSQDKIQ